MFGRGIEYKTPDQIRRMRTAGLVVADIHDAVRAAIAPGVTTGELDQVAAQVLQAAGATSNFLGYHGFPGRLRSEERRVGKECRARWRREDCEKIGTQKEASQCRRGRVDKADDWRAERS